MRSRLFGCLGTAAMAGLLATGAVAQVPGVTADEIVIGSFGPTTGNAYVYGTYPMNGIEVVFDKVNQAGGVHGRKLRLIREDDRCAADGAIAAVRRLAYDHKVFAILGGACTSATLAAKPEMVRSEVPTLINVAVGDPITHPPEKNLFSIIVTASLESAAQFRFAQEQGAKRIAVIAQRDAWGMPRYEPLMAAFAAAGIKPVADEEIADDANDATPQALRLRAANPDVVIVVTRPKAASALLRDAVKVGLKPDWWVAQTAVQDLDGLQKQVAIPGVLDNFVTIAYTKYQLADPEVADWVKRMNVMFPNDKPSSWALAGVASALVMVEALQRTGPEPTREKFLEVVGNMKGFETNLFPGPITCNAPKSHQCNRGFAWIRKQGNDVKTFAVTVVD